MSEKSKFGICLLSVVSVQKEADDSSEIITELLYGDHFNIKEHRKKWSRIQIVFDNCEGWVKNTQFHPLAEDDFNTIETNKALFIEDLIANIIDSDQLFTPILLGSRVDVCSIFNQEFEGEIAQRKSIKQNLINTASQYLNAPFQSGGKTPFGIDASGLTQMVYKINGYQLFRETEKQATQGTALSFIEESEAGDLAFFDNKEGIIDHVGIILPNNYIIHSFGKVRVDRIDHTGIFNAEIRQYTHKLRVIKSII